MHECYLRRSWSDAVDRREMPVSRGRGGSVGLSERLVASVTAIRHRGQRLAQLHRELLSSELRETGRQFGTAVGLWTRA